MRDGSTVHVLSTCRSVREWHTALNTRASGDTVWPFESRHGLVNFPALAFAIAKSANNSVDPVLPDGVDDNDKTAWRLAMYLYACAAGETYLWMSGQRNVLAKADKSTLNPFLGKGQPGEVLFQIFKPLITADGETAQRRALLDAVQYFSSAR